MKFFKSTPKPVAKPVAKAGGVTLQTPFHAVAIKSGPDCCQASKAMEGKRFLSRGTPPPPKLPLADCDRQMQCQCRYLHFDDRRTEVRRNVWGASFATGNGSEHFAKTRAADQIRKGRGRRKDD